MPSLAEDYRAKASECAELAAKTQDPRSKRVLEQTAEQWNALADGVEKYEPFTSRKMVLFPRAAAQPVAQNANRQLADRATLFRGHISRTQPRPRQTLIRSQTLGLSTQGPGF